MSEKSDHLVKTFARLANWEERYKKIIEMGRNLAPMREGRKVPANLVRGCQSRVWLWAEFDRGRVSFEADSEAAISKGIAALLLEVYNGETPRQILTLEQDFIDRLGLREHLSMSRANGLASMLKQISLYALAFQTKGES